LGCSASAAGVVFSIESLIIGFSCRCISRS
jgi:hypothetical protein